MNLKQLQEAYKAGKLTKAQYEAQLQDLLDAGEIAQDEYDQAADYDPNGPEDKAIYSQADVDRIVMRKATALVRKKFRDAGVEIDADNKNLLDKVVEMAKAGEGKAPGDLEKETAALRKQVAKLPQLEAENKRLTVEAAVLKTAAKYNPVNPSQVVRALNADYADLLEYDEDSGVLKSSSVEKAIKRIAEVEPNLFTAAPGDGDGAGTGQKPAFAGKPPGGAAQSSQQPGDKTAAKVAEALAVLGIKTGNQ